MRSKHSLLYQCAAVLCLVVVAATLSAQAATKPALKFSEFGDALPTKSKPKMPDGGIGFGGPIVNITSCVCKDLGILITIGGPYGGSYLYSFTNRPNLSVGQIFMSGGFVLGSAKSGGKCGTLSHGSCDGKTTDGIITMIGGLLQ